MRIVISSDSSGLWWWRAVGEDGETVAVSVPHSNRPDCVRAVAEVKVEGPAAPVTYEDSYPAGRGSWSIPTSLVRAVRS